MACLGVHFVITLDQMQHLLDIVYEQDLDDVACDEALREAIREIENQWDKQHLFQTDKAWDAIHRSLCEDNTPNGELNPNKGEYPLKLCILGGEQLYQGNDYCICLIRPEQVRDVAQALAGVTESWLRERFFRLDAKKVIGYSISVNEFDYTWSNFQGLPGFFARAAAEGRAVVFTVDH